MAQHENMGTYKLRTSQSCTLQTFARLGCTQALFRNRFVPTDRISIPELTPPPYIMVVVYRRVTTHV